MKTIFSLIYFECCKNESDLTKALNGPFLFESEESAKEKLLSHIHSRVAGDDDAFAEATKLAEDNLPGNANNPLVFSILTDWFKRYSNDNDVYFGFKIEELPASSFREELIKADAIEIDGNFIRHFNLTPSEEIDDGDSILFDASMTDDDMDRYEYYVSVTDAEEAVYDTQQKYWKVNDMNILLIKFSQS